jgi:DNA-binding NarL/FixJ family response regulator
MSARPRLIIADDDPSVCSLLTQILEPHFDVVGVAADAEEASTLAAAVRPDLALIDVQMPKGGGVYAVRMITKVSPATAIVALSADESPAGVLEILQAGAMSYRRKGCSKEILIDTLHRSMSAHSPTLSTPARQTG